MPRRGAGAAGAGRRPRAPCPLWHSRRGPAPPTAPARGRARCRADPPAGSDGRTGRRRARSRPQECRDRVGDLEDDGVALAARGNADDVVLGGEADGVLEQCVERLLEPDAVDGEQALLGRGHVDAPRRGTAASQRCPIRATNSPRSTSSRCSPPVVSSVSMVSSRRARSPRRLSWWTTSSASALIDGSSDPRRSSSTWPRAIVTGVRMACEVSRRNSRCRWTRERSRAASASTSRWAATRRTRATP